MRSCPWFALDREELRIWEDDVLLLTSALQKNRHQIDMQILAGRAHRRGEPFLSSVKFK